MKIPASREPHPYCLTMPDCPVCHSKTTPLPGTEKFSRCVQCGVVVHNRARSTEYEDDYFDKEYKNQYGRSYLDDEPQITQKAEDRIRKLTRLFPEITDMPFIRILEIGSSAGFFLARAKSRGWNVLGWEISRNMAKYANQNQIPTVQGDFLSLYEKWKKNPQHFDILAAFYALEHIPDQKKIWEAFSAMTTENGFLLLALPSTYGPVFYFHFNRWEKEHPADHFVDYSPFSLKMAARQYGFDLVAIFPESLHPERFPLAKHFGKPLAPVWNWIQDEFVFADTFYAILRKTNGD